MAKEIISDEFVKWLVPLLLTIIIFMMKRWVSRSDKKMDDFAHKFEEFTNIMNEEKVKVAVSAQGCIDKHLNIDTTIKEHTEKLNEHGKEILNIKRKIKIS